MRVGRDALEDQVRPALCHKLTHILDRPAGAVKPRPLLDCLQSCLQGDPVPVDGLPVPARADPDDTH